MSYSTMQNGYCLQVLGAHGLAGFGGFCSCSAPANASIGG